MAFLGLFGTPDVAKLSAKGDVQGLVKALRCKDTAVRQAALEALERLGSYAEPVLTATLEHRDVEVRQAAADILERIHGRQRAISILQTLDQGQLSPEEQPAKIAELAAIGTPAVEPMIDAYSYKSSSYLRTVLEKMGGTAVVPLVALLKGSDLERLDRIAGLLSWSEGAAVEALIALLEHEEVDTRWNAALALGYCGTPRAVEALRAVIGLPGSPLALDPVALMLDLTARYPQGVSKTRGEWQLVKVGHLLNALGGLPFMLEVHEAYTRRLAQENVRAYQDGWSRNVDRWWDGIGEWRG